ncbi:MAG: S8 family serine peptidase [bacterium]
MQKKIKYFIISGIFLIIVVALLSVIYFLLHKNSILPETGGNPNVQETYIVELKSEALLDGYQIINNNKDVNSKQATADKFIQINNDQKNVISGIASKVKLSETKLTSERNLYSTKAVANTIILKLTASEANAISSLPNVASVFPDMQIAAALDESVPLIKVPEAWSVNNGSNCNSGKCTDGKGVKIAVVDSGIDYTLPDLGGCFGLGCKVAGGYDFVNMDPDPMDDHYHGTHVAGIIAGTGSKYQGIAPGATLYSYKVLGKNGYGYSSAIILALEMAIDPNHDGNFSDKADVINFSIQTKEMPNPWRYMYNKTFARINAVGSVLVVCAGNYGPQASTASIFTYIPGTIVVGNTTKTDQMNSSSSRGPINYYGWDIKPDVVAPGTKICATRAKSYVLPTNFTHTACDAAGQYFLLTGTSMSTPHIVGVVALMKQIQTGLNTEQIKSILKSSSQDLGLPPNDQGAGRVNALAAVSAAQRMPDFPVVELENLYTYLATQKEIQIKGKITSSNLAKYEIFISPLNKYPQWTLVAESTKVDSTLLATIKVNSITPGNYYLKIVVTDKANQKALDYGYLVISVRPTLKQDYRDPKESKK